MSNDLYYDNNTQTIKRADGVDILPTLATILGLVSGSYPQGDKAANFDLKIGVEDATNQRVTGNSVRITDDCTASIMAGYTAPQGGFFALFVRSAGTSKVLTFDAALNAWGGTLDTGADATKAFIVLFGCIAPVGLGASWVEIMRTAAFTAPS